MFSKKPDEYSPSQPVVRPSGNGSTFSIIGSDVVIKGDISATVVLLIDGRIEARPVLPVTATIDHRYVDGWHIARAMKSFRAYLDSPAAFEPHF